MTNSNSIALDVRIIMITMVSCAALRGAALRGGTCHGV